MAVVAFKMWACGTGKTEIHALNGGDNYQSFTIQTGTPIEETNADTFYFGNDGAHNVYAVKKRYTGTGHTEVHILNRGDNFQSFLLQTGTALENSAGNFDFAVSPNGDLICIKVRETGTGHTEVHVLSRASNFQSFIHQTGTPIEQTTTGTFDFLAGTNNDLYAIKKNNTGSGKTEVHILTAASGYQSFSLQTGTALEQNHGEFQFGLTAENDLVCIKTRGTGTGKAEVHILTKASGYQHFRTQTGTPLETGDYFQFLVAH